MNPHIVTNIKKKVQETHEHNYLMSKQKRELKYYSLYLPDIIKIQRWFRKILLKKTQYLQKQIQNQLNIYNMLKREGDRLDNRLKHTKMSIEKAKNNDLDQMIEGSKQNIQRNMQGIISNIVNRSNQLAKNNALGKVLMYELKQMKAQQEKLQAQIKELEFEKERRRNRNEDWQQKLGELRNKIFKENSQRRKLQNALTQY